MKIVETRQQFALSAKEQIAVLSYWRKGMAYGIFSVYGGY
jgi:hypothetical protein